MAKGVSELEEWQKTGRVLTRKQAIYAFCADCMSLFVDTKDCANNKCPLYPHSPYNHYIEPKNK